MNDRRASDQTNLQAPIDELHEHPTDSMVSLIKKNIKGRPNALVLMITNSGVFDPESVCWRYHDYAVKVADGSLQDDEFFSYVCALDVGDDWKDPAVWKKSCPMLGVTIPYSYLEKEVREAVGMPSNQSLTRRLNFCEWVEASNPAVTREVWRANGGSVPIDQLRGRKCYGGLDLSGKNDLTALELVFPMDDGSKAVLSFFWTPKDTLASRADRDRAPYVDWVRDGHLNATPGKTIDYRYVAKEIGRLTRDFRIEGIAFDKVRIGDLERELDAEGVEVNLVEHPQGFISMSPAIEALEDDLLEHRLRHGNHPVLTWCIANSDWISDPAGNRKFDKRRAMGRIDGAVALAMACGLSGHPKAQKKFQVFLVG